MFGGMFSWSAGDLGSAMVEGLTDWIAGEEREPDTRPGDVQGQFNQQRDGVRTAAADVGFEGAFHPRAVLEQDQFERDDVAKLRRRVDAIDLTAVGDLIGAWKATGDRARASLETFTAGITRLTNDGVWQGAAAEAALAASREYATHGAQLPNAALLTSNKLAELKTGLEPTKLLVPHPPEDRSFLDNSRFWIAGRGWRSNTEANDTAKAEALRVLRTVFAPVVRESDTNVPVLPQPYNPVQPGDPPVISGPGPGPGGPGPGGPGPGGTPGNEPETPITDPDDTDDDPGATTPSSSTPSSTDPAATTPASTTPAATPTNPVGAPGSPGSPGPGGPGSPGPGTPSTPSPGGSIRGVPVPATQSAPSSAASAATRAGMTGLGGLGAPGARGGKSDEESTKGVPDYLISQEHGDELTGLSDLPRTVPPVIGE
ncbi:hypothetical protein APR08_001055 [Nocardia amikacinitolerans]|nr:hypothetical protein [Nocardia amikacinitolerans]MCP2288152.1 hypothetical protein [Nocardia amikacinitolerans]